MTKTLKIALDLDQCVFEWQTAHEQKFNCKINTMTSAEITAQVEQCKNDNAEMIVYPNPTNGVFTIEMQNDKDALNEMSLYDYRGILVNSFSFIGNTKVDIREKPAGAYLLRVVGDEYVRSVIVIKH